jgi:ankyrin repeat protein
MNRDPSSSATNASQGLPPLPSMERLQELWFDAARSGCDDVIPALLRAGIDIEACDARGHTALVLASYNNRISTTELLLSCGAAVDGAGDERGNTALMGIAFKGYDAIAKLLIGAGAEVDRRNGAGQTALMMAALFGKTTVVKMLIDAGADVAASDAAGNSAGTLASAQGNVEMADQLQRSAAR